MTREKVHHIIYLFSLLLLAGSIPVSNFGMSIGGLLLCANWIAEWNWKEKWQRLKEQRTVFFLSSFFFIFLFGLINTENWNSALDNILSKLPLLYAPLVLASSSKLNGKEIRLVLTVFILVTLGSTLISIIYMITHPIQDIRDISLFISHIRFSFCIIIAIIFAIQFALRVTSYSRIIKILYFLIAGWFISYLFISQTFTGIILLFVITFTYFLYMLITGERTKIRKIMLLSIITGIIVFMGHLFTITYNYYHVALPEQLPTHTISGNPYTHNFKSIIENGSYTELYLCEKELRESWPERSNIPYDSVRPSLIRYLNSKGLFKDREGIYALNKKDIHNIEHKIANLAYTQVIGVKKALYPTFFSLSLYKQTKEITHSSILQRFELWQTSIKIIRNNLLTGIGIGDHKEAIDQQLTKDHSPLRKNMGAHNQFLTLLLMGGLLPLLAFIIMLFIPFFIHKNAGNLNYLFFFIIIFCSFFTEDTLETQAGMTFYAFLNAFLLFCFDFKKMTEEPADFQLIHNKSKKHKLNIEPNNH